MCKRFIEGGREQLMPSWGGVKQEQWRKVSRGRWLKASFKISSIIHNISTLDQSTCGWRGAFRDEECQADKPQNEIRD